MILVYVMLFFSRPVQMKPRPWKIVEQEVSFHRNGTVITGAGDAGTWWFDVGGLYWVSLILVPVPVPLPVLVLVGDVGVAFIEEARSSTALATRGSGGLMCADSVGRVLFLFLFLLVLILFSPERHGSRR